LILGLSIDTCILKFRVRYKRRVETVNYRYQHRVIARINCMDRNVECWYAFEYEFCDEFMHVPQILTMSEITVVQTKNEIKESNHDAHVRKVNNLCFA